MAITIAKDPDGRKLSKGQKRAAKKAAEAAAALSAPIIELNNVLDPTKMPAIVYEPNTRTIRNVEELKSGILLGFGYITVKHLLVLIEEKIMGINGE